MRDAECQLLFVVGASRSGTTMLNRIMGQHPAILALNELHFFGELWDPRQPDPNWTRATAEDATAVLLQRVRHGIFSGMPDADTREEAGRLITDLYQQQPTDNFSAAALFRHVLSHLPERDGEILITDQTPRNIFYAAELLEQFPGSRVVQIVRDPRAVLFSQRKRWTKKWRGAASMPWKNVLRVLVNYHPLTMIKLWSKAVRQGHKLKDHPRYHELKFESLTQEPEEQLTALCSFLGIPFDERMLDVPQVGSSHSQHNFEKRGISASYSADWRNHLPKGDILIAEKAAAGLMQELGYDAIARPGWYPWLLLPFLRLPFHVLGAVIANPKRTLIQMRALLGGGKETQ